MSCSVSNSCLGPRAKHFLETSADYVSQNEEIFKAVSPVRQQNGDCHWEKVEMGKVSPGPRKRWEGLEKLQPLKRLVQPFKESLLTGFCQSGVRSPQKWERGVSGCESDRPVSSCHAVYSRGEVPSVGQSTHTQTAHRLPLIRGSQ